MYLLIVRRDQRARYEQLARECAGQTEVRVILDRRLGERRPAGPAEAPEGPAVERRKRPEVDLALRTAGWALVELGPAGAAPAADDTGRRVLIVDDDPYVADMLREHFGRTHTVDVARDGVVGLAKTILRRPDVILLDMTMPLMDGLTVLRHVQSLDASIPVIMITGNDDSRLAGETLRSGVLSYVPKPFDLQYLDHLVATALERRER